MIGMRDESLPGRSVSRTPVRRRLPFVFVIAIAFIAIMAFTTLCMLDRALAIAGSTASAIGLTERERTDAQRVTALATQYALGDRAARRALGPAIARFEATHWRLIAGDRGLGFAPVIGDPDLGPVYFHGTAPLDAVATQFATRARHIAAQSPSARVDRAEVRALGALAETPLLDGLDTALRVRGARSEAQMNALRDAGNAAFTCTLGALFALVAFVGAPLQRRLARLARTVDELAGVVTIDPLTGMLNKTTFHARGAIEIQKARRYGRPLSLIIIDAGDLPTIEDTYGRDGGEIVLKALTSSVCAGTRVCDVVARVNDEQFAILLPETNRDGAHLLAERLLRKISDLAVPIDDTVVTCTVSIGVASAEKNASFLWPTLKRADEALYEAKMRGRNRVVVAA